MFSLFFSIFSVYPRFLCSKMVNVHVFFANFTTEKCQFSMFLTTLLFITPFGSNTYTSRGEFEVCPNQENPYSYVLVII